MPPTNHLAQGYFHSKTLFHGENHSSSCATLPQNVSGPRSTLVLGLIVFDIGVGLRLRCRLHHTIGPLQTIQLFVHAHVASLTIQRH